MTLARLTMEREREKKGTIQIFVDKMSVNLCDLGFNNVFLDIALQVQSYNRKIDKLYIIHI